MLGVFSVNVYIGLYDTNLTQISPVHTELNWVIAAADLLAAIFLFVKPGNLIFKSLGGNCLADLLHLKFVHRR